MKCQACKKPIAKQAKFCPKCGQPVVSKDGSNTEYFAVSPKRVVILSFLTTGLYELYWFYKNWKMVKKSEGSSIHPFLRALFFVFYCYSLFKKVLQSAKSHGYKDSFSPGWLAAAYIGFSIFMTVVSRYENPNVVYNLVWLAIGGCSVFLFLPVQKAINYSNEKLKGSTAVSKGFSLGEMVVIFVGILMTISMIFSIVAGNISGNDTSAPSTQTQTEQTELENEKELTPEDAVRQADYDEGYKSGYTDGRSPKGNFQDSYNPPATEERKEAYGWGYMEGFLTGCNEGNFDCAEIEEAYSEALQESEPPVQGEI